MQRLGFDPWVGKSPWRKAWQPTSIFLSGESHGQRSLVGYSPLGHKSQTGLSDFTFTFSGGDGVPAELFQILKDNAVKVLHSICQQIWKTEQWSQAGKGQFSFQSQRRAMPKNVHTTTQFRSCHMLAK